MAEILNAHGSKNDIFVAAMTPRDFACGDDLRVIVRRLCDRAGPFGGDGIYFYDAGPRIPEAWFFNPDGSPAEFCGNGMRCLGRVVLDQRGADSAVIRSGQAEYTVRRGATTAGGVRQISIEQPAVEFTPRTPVVAGRNPLTGARLPELEYPAGVHLRRISQQGSVKWKSERTFISEVLAYEYVGLREIRDDRLEVWFGPLLVGWLDTQRGKFWAVASKKSHRQSSTRELARGARPGDQLCLNLEAPPAEFRD